MANIINGINRNSGSSNPIVAYAFGAQTVDIDITNQKTCYYCLLEYTTGGYSTISKSTDGTTFTAVASSALYLSPAQGSFDLTGVKKVRVSVSCEAANNWFAIAHAVCV